MEFNIRAKTNDQKKQQQVEICRYLRAGEKDLQMIADVVGVHITTVYKYRAIVFPELARKYKKRGKVERVKVVQVEEPKQVALDFEAPPEMLPPPPTLISIDDYVSTLTIKEEGKPVDMVDSPPHYTVGGIETIDFIRAKLTRDQYIGYLRGNMMKYIARLGYKDSVGQDAGKLAWYSRELHDFVNKENSSNG